MVRCDVDAVMHFKGSQQLLSVKALNEFDPKCAAFKTSQCHSPLHPPAFEFPVLNTGSWQPDHKSDSARAQFRSAPNAHWWIGRLRLRVLVRRDNLCVHQHRKRRRQHAIAACSHESLWLVQADGRGLAAEDREPARRGARHRAEE